MALALRDDDSAVVVSYIRSSMAAALQGETNMRLDNKVALVTGAASGFGQGIAATFAREGARVAVIDIDGEAAREAAASISNKAIAVRCDVSQRADVDA